MALEAKNKGERAFWGSGSTLATPTLGGGTVHALRCQAAWGSSPQGRDQPGGLPLLWHRLHRDAGGSGLAEKPMSKGWKRAGSCPCEHNSPCCFSSTRAEVSIRQQVTAGPGETPMWDFGNPTGGGVATGEDFYPP